MRNCLLKPDGSILDPKWSSLLNARKIDRLILHDPDWREPPRSIAACFWTTRSGASRRGSAAAPFGRRSGAAAPSEWTPYDRRLAAYAPAPDCRAPLVGPAMPQPPGFFDAFYRVHDDRSPDRGEAALHLTYFDLAAERRQLDLGTQWLLAEATGLIGSGTGTEPAGTASLSALRLFLTPPPSADSPSAVGPFARGFMASHDRGPLDALLLSVRAARRAVAADPDDAGAFLLLEKPTFA